MAKTGVAVVTGASAGLGRAMVRALAPRGLRLAPLARGRAGLKAAASKARERHGEAPVLPIIPPERNSRPRVRRERSETPMIPRLSEAAGSAADVALTAEERPSEKRLPNH